MFLKNWEISALVGTTCSDEQNKKFELNELAYCRHRITRKRPYEKVENLNSV